MTDFHTARDPIIGWEAIQPVFHDPGANPWDERIERAWARKDEEIETLYYAGSSTTEIDSEWMNAIGYLRFMQDRWTVANVDCSCRYGEGSCDACLAATRLSNQFSFGC